MTGVISSLIRSSDPTAIISKICEQSTCFTAPDTMNRKDTYFGNCVAFFKSIRHASNVFVQVSPEICNNGMAFYFALKTL
jgi:hypothetical protein